MNAEHSRAVELTSSPPDSLLEDERSWLARHLEGCPPCRGAQAALGELRVAAGGEPADAPDLLVRRTKTSLRRRIAERERVAAGRVHLLIAAWGILAAGSAVVFTWRGIEWLGRLAGLSPAAGALLQVSLWTLACTTSVLACLAASERPSVFASVSGVEGDRR